MARTELHCPGCKAIVTVDPVAAKVSQVCTQCGTALVSGDGIAARATMAVADPAAFRKGEKFAGFVIEARIGKGGMGEVFRARQISMNRTVALKVMKPEYTSNPEYAQRFVREARSAGRLNHPNIVQVYDVGCRDKTYYIAMELIEGETLDQTIRTRGRLTVTEAVTVAVEVARALKEAAGQGIIHRDIKPENIMLTPRGQVKVADFGLARTMNMDEPSLTGTGIILGTPLYMAPEQVQGARDIDARADIYSLGCTLFHMATGAVPFPGQSAYEVLKRHETEPVRFPREIELPAALKAVVTRMMAKVPADRFDNAAAVIHALETIRANEHQAPVSAPAGRRKWLWAAVAVAAVVLAAVVLMLARPAAPVPPGPAVAVPASPSTPPPGMPPAPPPAGAERLGPAIPFVVAFNGFSRSFKVLASEMLRKLPVFMRHRDKVNAEIIKSLAQRFGLSVSTMEMVVAAAGQGLFAQYRGMGAGAVELPAATVDLIMAEHAAAGDLREQAGRRYFVTPRGEALMADDKGIVIAADPAAAAALITDGGRARLARLAASLGGGTGPDLVAAAGITGAFLREAGTVPADLAALAGLDRFREGTALVRAVPGGIAGEVRFQFDGLAATPLGGAPVLPPEALAASRLPAGGRFYLACGLPAPETAAALFGREAGGAWFASAALRTALTVLRAGGGTLVMAGSYDDLGLVAEVPLARSGTVMEQLRGAGFTEEAPLAERTPGRTGVTRRPVGFNLLQFTDAAGVKVGAVVVPGAIYLTSAPPGQAAVHLMKARLPQAGRPAEGKPVWFAWPAVGPGERVIGIAVTEQKDKFASIVVRSVTDAVDARIVVNY